MSTAIREAAPVTDDRPGRTDPTTHRTDSRTDESATAPRPANPPSPSSSQDQGTDEVGGELATMLEHSLRMLPRALLEPAVTASCPWFTDLPPAAARQCLADLQEARLEADVAPVLAAWRRRALPFAS